MKINNKTKLFIACLAAYILIASIVLLSMKLVTVPALLCIIFILPVLLITDICFVLMPLALIVLFCLVLFTLIKRNYEKFNKLYALILIIITLGITNINIDRLYGNPDYAYKSYEYIAYWLLLFGAIITFGIIYIAKKKDTRIYIATYVMGLILYITYQIANMLD